MGFQRVKFNNFRNIKSHEIKLSGGLNMITGLNGAGKTNFLEGINLLSGWGTLEAGTKIKELAKRGSNENKILLTGQIEGVYGEIIQARIENRVSMRINDSAVSAHEIRFKNPVLSFLPNDTQLVEGNSGRRRRLLDMIISILVAPYAKRMNDYKVAVRQKTALLKEGKNTEIIERVIKPLAVWIWKMRKEAVCLISREIENFSDIVPQNAEIIFCRGGGNLTDCEEEDYSEAVKKYKDKEKQYGIVAVGPHRDDILLKSDGNFANAVLSRGYRRRFAIALMLASADGILRKTGHIPTLLLDEVTAELDSKGRKILFETLKKRKAQVIAATAEPFYEQFEGKKYKVTDGFVEEI